MRYFYIICLIMSSFFTYKNCFATEKALKYAFFMPQNVFQENTNVEDINKMKPRYEKKQPAEKKEIIKKTEPQKETLSKNSGLVNNIKKPKISLPYVRRPIVASDEVQNRLKEKEATQNKPAEIKKEPIVAPEPPKMNDEMKKKLSKYVLGDDFGVEDSPDVMPTIDKEQLLKKDITQMLADIPFADRNQPKFKQCYNDYGADLRILFHRGKFPSNPKQDAVLNKVNSSKRFEIK